MLVSGRLVSFIVSFVVGGVVRWSGVVNVWWFKVLFVLLLVLWKVIGGVIDWVGCILMFKFCWIG